MMKHTVARVAAPQMLVAAAIFVGTLCLAVGCRPAPTPSEQDIVEHFRYGVLGTEETVGVPYWIFRVLPIVFADKLPNRPGTGWEKLGFIQEAPDREADWYDARQRQLRRRARGSELRDLPHGHAPRNTIVAAPDRARHAGERDGSPGLFAFPDDDRTGPALHRG